MVPHSFQVYTKREKTTQRENKTAQTKLTLIKFNNLSNHTIVHLNEHLVTYSSD